MNKDLLEKIEESLNVDTIGITSKIPEDLCIVLDYHAKLNSFSRSRAIMSILNDFLRKKYRDLFDDYEV